MVRVWDLSREGWTFDSRWRILWASKRPRVCQYVVFLVSCSLPFTITPRNLSELLQGPASWIGSSTSMCEKKIGAWKIVFLQSPISSHKTIRGHATKKMNRKGELQTSRISSNLRIWQSYSRVPQILKVLCVWYSWKYVARLGFEPLKFLYSEFLYNTQAVVDQSTWDMNILNI